MSEFFKVDNGTFSPNKKYFINNVSFKIFNKGDIVSLLGPSGVGKTSILRTIAGLDKLIDGEIWLDKQLISSKNFNLQPEKRGVSLTFQNNCLFPHMNLKQNIMISKQGGLNINEVDHLIKNFYLKDMVDKFPHEVSSGEAQRAALIRSIVSNPKLLLLDEPFSNLNKGLREELQVLLKQILKEKKITSIIVTHDYDEAFYFGDMCGVLINQKMIQFAEPYKIYHHPNSPEIADFFNKGEFIEAKITSKNQLFHEKLGVIKGTVDPKFQIGTVVKLLIQAEDLIHSDKSNLEFKIIDKRFVGTNFIYTLEISKNEKIHVLVHSHHSHIHNIGKKFGIKTPISLEHVVCFEK